MNELYLEELKNSLIDQISKIEIGEISESTSDERDISTKIVEKQKVYFWIRLYLKEEVSDIQIGDDFEIKYKLSGEKLNTKFIAYAKKNLNRDLDNEIVNYDPEDNLKVLCLMVDEDDIENSENIPFIRTLFKTSKYFQNQIYRRVDLTFTNLRTDVSFEYTDVDF